jgi:probable HAF family extracellular repeat protein
MDVRGRIGQKPEGTPMPLISAGSQMDSSASPIRMPILSSATTTIPHTTENINIERPGVNNASGGGWNISRNGDYAVGYVDDGFGTPFQAFRWSAPDGLMGLGTLGSSGTFAQDVSNDGSVVVGFSNHAFRWTQSGGMVDLGTAAGNSAEFISRAYGVSGDGNVVVGQSVFLNPSGDRVGSAFRWTPSGGFQSLGPDSSEAYAVSEDGATIVGLGRSSQAFRWTAAGGSQLLGALPGHQRSVALAVSDDGKVVVGLSHNSHFDRAGTGGDFRYDPAGSRAFYWTEPTGMQDLTQLLVDRGVDLKGMTLNAALGMSADGMWIHGVTTMPDPEFPDLFVITVPMLVSLQAPTVLPGDFNKNGMVDSADYVVWRKGLGTTHIEEDYGVWQANFGKTAGSGAMLPSAPPLPAAVPEPSTMLICLIAMIAMRFRRDATADVMNRCDVWSARSSDLQQDR